MNEVKNIVAREDRCPGISYTDMLEGDTRTPPDYLFEETNIELGDEPLSVEPYISEEFAAAERERMWPNVWLFAAREDEMPEPGRHRRCSRSSARASCWSVRRMVRSRRSTMPACTEAAN